MTDWNEIIETLCDKFGLAVDQAAQLIPQIVLQHYVICIAWIIVGILLLLVGGYIVLKFIPAECQREADEYNEEQARQAAERPEYAYRYTDRRTARYYENDYAGLCVFAVCVMVVGAICIVPAVITLASWIVSPEAHAIKYIVSWFVECT